MLRVIALSVSVVCLCVTAACESPTSPVLDQITLTSQLSAANEVPPVTNADAAGTGIATVILKFVRNGAGTITGATADVAVSLTGFVPGTTLTAAHIHVGAVGVNGDPVVDTGVTTGQVVLTNGSGSFSRTGISVSAEVARALETMAFGHYFNVHTVLTPSGAVRGQLTRS